MRFFMWIMSQIIKVLVRVISLNLQLLLIKFTWTSIIQAIAKKNDVVVEETSAYNAVLLKPSSRWKKTPVDLDETSASNSFAIITISMSDCF